MFTRKDTCCLNQHHIKVLYYVAFRAVFLPPCSVCLLVWRIKAGEKVQIAMFSQFGLLNTEIVLAQAILVCVFWPQWLEQDWEKQKMWEKGWMTFLSSYYFFFMMFFYNSHRYSKKRGWELEGSVLPAPSLSAVGNDTVCILLAICSDQ